MKSKSVLFGTALLCAVVLACAGHTQRPLPAARPYLRAAALGPNTETPHEQLDRLAAEYNDALARANDLSTRLDAMLADAKAKNASILQRAKPICDQLGGTLDDAGTCLFTCPHNEPGACDTKTRDFNQQAASLIQEKQATMTSLKVFASLVQAAWADAASKKQAWEQVQAQLEKH